MSDIVGLVLLSLSFLAYFVFLVIGIVLVRRRCKQQRAEREKLLKEQEAKLVPPEVEMPPLPPTVASESSDLHEIRY